MQTKKEKKKIIICKLRLLKFHESSFHVWGYFDLKAFTSIGTVPIFNAFMLKLSVFLRVDSVNTHKTVHI